MTIRRKLMILFLGITLIPLIGIVTLNRVTRNVIRDQVSSDIRTMLEDNAAYTLQDVVEDYDQLLRANMQVLLNLPKYY